MEFLVPRRGTYLCLQLDPVKMVEPLNDPALSAAARDLRMQKYIALVSDIDELPMPNKPDHKCYVELVGSGLCREDEDAYMKSSMCTPIFPATEHPLSRRPLRPVPSFPFPNCYHHSFAALTVRIPNKLYNHEHAVTLNQRDLLADNIYVSEDCRMRDALADAKSGVAAAPQDDVSEDLHGSHSATSSVIRELVRQGVPVVYADDSQAETAPVAVASARGHESGGNVETDGGGKTVEEAMAASEELEPSVAGPGPHRYEGLASPSVIGAAPEPGTTLPRTIVQTDTPGGVTADPAGRASLDSRLSNEPLALAPEPGTLPPKEDVGDKATSSMIESVSDRPVATNSTTSDVLMNVFLGNPSEDRIIIPLVNVWLSLSEVSEVNDPNDFLQEVENIVQLIQESRRRCVAPGHDSRSLGSAKESWVDLAVDMASVGDQDVNESARSKFRIRVNSAILNFKLRARRIRQGCVTLSKVAKAVITCSFTVRVVVTMDLD